MSRAWWGLSGLILGLFARCGRVGAPAGQGAAPAAQRGRMTLTLSVADGVVLLEEKLRSSGFGRVGVVAAPSRCCWVGHAEVSGAGHPFAAVGRHGADTASRAGSIKRATAPLCGGHDRPRARAGLGPRSSCGGLFQAADAAVAQAVEQQGKQPAGGGDLADVAAAAVGDAVTVDAQLEIDGESLDRLDRGPADQPGALTRWLWPRCTVVSDSWWRGVSPAHEHSWAGRRNRPTSPISRRTPPRTSGPPRAVSAARCSRGGRPAARR